MLRDNARLCWTIGFAITVLALGLVGCASSPKATKNTSTDKDHDINANPVSLDPSKYPITDFYPMKSGMVKDYVRSEGFKNFPVKATFGQVTDSGGKKMVIVTSVSLDDKGQPRLDANKKPIPKSVETHLWDPNAGLFIDGTKVGEITAAGQKVLPAKWEEGARWQRHMQLGTAKKPTPATLFGVVGKPERVDTPAGQFEAMTSEITISWIAVQNGRPGTGSLYSKYWFVKDLGIVKVSQESNNQRVSLMLAKKP